MRLSVWFGFLLFSSIAFAAPTQLTIGIIQEWSPFNPITNVLASNEALFPFIQRKMVKRSSSGAVLPDVAESVPVLKNNKAIWVIRKNAKWADGTDITCADWQLGWQAGLNPNTSVDARSYYEKIISIQWSTQKPKTCEVTYKSSDWSFDRDLPPLIPSHIEKTIFEKYKNQPEGYDRQSAYVTSTLNKGLYNGPYYVSEFKLGSHVIFNRNEHFFGQRPYFDRIIVKLITDTNTLKANLMSKQIEAISAVGFPPDTAILFQEDFQKQNLNFKVHFQNSGIFQGVYFNQNNSILQDIHVREALARSLDKNQIAQAFFNNQLQPAESILSPQHPSYSNPKSEFSKNKAREILDQAGWKVGKNNIREKNGKSLSFVFKTSAGLKILENLQVYICDQFKSIGAQCVIKNEPPRVLLGQSVPRGEFDLAMYGQPIPPDTSLAPYFSSKFIPTEKNNWAGANSMRINSVELDQLLNLFEMENNVTKRNLLMKKIENLFQKNYWLIPLYHRREAIVMPKNLVGITDSFEGTSYLDPEKWVVK